MRSLSLGLVLALLLLSGDFAIAELPGATLEEAGSPDAESVAADAAPNLTELLELDSDYGEGERCLSLHKFQRVRILDERHVMFELRGDRYYVAQLDRRCPGFERDSTVAYEHRSSKLCAKDRIRGIPLSGGFTPSCQLPRFQSVSKEQLALLREVLKTR